MSEAAAILSALVAGGPYGIAALCAAAAVFLWRAREKDRIEHKQERERSAKEIRELNQQLISTMGPMTTALTNTQHALSRVETFLLARK